MHVSVYPRAEFGCVLWAVAQNFVKRHALRRILLCAMGHSSEFLYALWTKAQNSVKHYEPQPRMIDHSPESNELHLKAFPNLDRNS
jgi:hypothetical protein